MNLSDFEIRSSFPKGITFKYPWRAYQQRVLDELETHLADDHLHIIAPPGSGKTVLGLEVALRINKPTLILAPTIAIRDQWIQRFCELFLQVKTAPEWISADIKEPSFLTVATYQALHAVCRHEEPFGQLDNGKRLTATGEEVDEITSFISKLQKQQLGTIMVDEAHHLKNAWWESIDCIKQHLDPTIVGLTATPPYDVSPGEWQRYISLNGPVDAEITVPELIAENTLCAHQDFVYYSLPSPLESQKIFAYRKQVKALYQELKGEEMLVNALRNHAVFQAPEDNLEWIYSNLPHYSALLVFLHAAGEEIPEIHREVIGVKDLVLPALDFNWMALLLDFYLFKGIEDFPLQESYREELAHRLRRAGVLEKKTISFWHSDKINRYLSRSLSKLTSIQQIVEFEQQQLGDGLRMVILTDYIRKEFLPNRPINDLELNRIGVMPIFEILRRKAQIPAKMAVLTGSLVIIPRAALEPLQRLAAVDGEDNIYFSALPYDSGFLEVTVSTGIRHRLVHWMTELFQQGHVSLLVGTKALLGEGWDAPAINSLIMASFVGSFVLSNQMRGRAIRKGKQEPEKTSNIWHLACLDPSDEAGGADMYVLRRRFKTFVGVSSEAPVTIQNGLDRLGMPAEINSLEQAMEMNAFVMGQAKDRNLLSEKWLDAIKNGHVLVEDIKIPFPKNQTYKQTKSLYYNRTIKAFAGLFLSALGSFGIQAIFGMTKVSRYIFTIVDLKDCLLGLGVVAMIIFGRFSYKMGRMYVKYRDIGKDVHKIAEALLIALLKAKFIRSDKDSLRVISDVDAAGTIYCHLEGGSTFEKSLFIKSLQEIIEQIDNPRYLIIRKSFFLKLLAQRDYHAVPEALGRNKQFAQIFEAEWRRSVGDCELVYTRSLDGRKSLLRARMSSLASEFEQKPERIMIWK
ncbi:DEAD/DEAH box helicase [Echinicola soli]|uniref:DEAD/DEAH box helicase n=1 Tax=Echinicola soli TaxID=2591634 RepID=A0A514CGI3_9BACT|nr:DEAD/DEAH box helicase family protein [Echinicola soli]QDH78931.1 DEAD/DEAH box helicase [Echinicola soli]